MAFGTDSIGLVFKIRSDSSDAKKDLSDFAGKLAGVSQEGVEAFSQLGESAGPMGAAIAGAAVVATVALTATVAVTIALTEKLYDLAKSSSEFGSKIHDAAQQAGVTAETMSALKIAADQSGSSLEKIAASVAKFDTLLGQAENGNKKAEATLKQYGITATGTDEALAQAVQTIALMTDKSLQAAAAAALFKDRTGEILPVIDSFDGDLPGLMKHLRDLGLIMSREDADAADKFGDQVDTLNSQLDAITRNLGTAVMPAFSQFFVSLSGWLADNKSEIASWSSAVGAALNRVAIELRSFLTGLRSAAMISAALVSGNTFALSGLIAEDQSNTAFYNNLRSGSGGAVGGIGAGIRRRGGGGGGGSRDGGRSAGAGRDDSAKKDLDDEFSAEKTKLSGLQKAYDEALEKIRREFADTKNIDKFKEAVSALRDSTVSDMQKAVDGVNKLQLKLADPTRQKAALADNEKRIDDLNDHLEKSYDKDEDLLKKALQSKYKSWSDHIGKLEKDQDKYDAEEQRSFDERNDSWRKFLQKKQDDQQKYDDEADRSAKERAAIAKARDEAPLSQGVSGGIAGSLGVSLPSIFGNTGEIKNQAEFLKSVYQDVANVAGEAIGSMVNGLASLLSQWVITGHFSAKAALQMASGIALGVAMQAAIKGIFEVAESIAAAARLDPVSASLHAAAAKVYFITAAIAGGIGVGTGIASRFVGANNSAGGSVASSTAPTGPNYNDPNDPHNSFRSPFRGYGQTQAVAQDRSLAINGELAQELRMFREKFAAVSPGQVIMAGAPDAGGAIADSYHNHLEGSLTAGNQARRLVGERA